jgi:amino acid transporter
MGYTFVALQGFEFIAVMAGEIKSPTENIPRAMMLSLAISLLVSSIPTSILLALSFQKRPAMLISTVSPTLKEDLL